LENDEPGNNKPMSLLRLALLGVLVIAAPLFSQIRRYVDPEVREGVLEWFQLDENAENVSRILGTPALMVPFGDFVSWQYQIGVEDTHEYSHQLVFRKSDGALISVTRNYEHERIVDEWFPQAGTAVYHYPDASHPQYSARVRRLSGGRVLMAMGVSRAGQAASQVTLFRESELKFFHPWLFQQLRENHGPPLANSSLR
jgi:hypothetical protein